jgi:hypothetical protein
MIRRAWLKVWLNPLRHLGEWHRGNAGDRQTADFEGHIGGEHWQNEK